MSDRRIPSNLNSASASAAGEAVYLAGGNGGDELQRAVEISVIGAAGAGVATFFPEVESSEDTARVEKAAMAAAIGGQILPQWQRWLQDRFEPVLGPAFCRVHEAVGQMRIDEVLRADAMIDEALDDDEVRRSKEAGVAFLEGREQVKHMPQLVRLSKAIDKADASGHVTTLFAMQAGLYHLPRLPALVSYAYFEWLGGVMAAGWTGPRGVENFEAFCPETFDCVRRIVHAPLDGAQASIFVVE